MWWAAIIDASIEVGEYSEARSLRVGAGEAVVHAIIVWVVADLRLSFNSIRLNLIFALNSILIKSLIDGQVNIRAWLVTLEL